MRNFVLALIGFSLLTSGAAFATSSRTSSGGATLTQMPLEGYPTPEEILKIEEQKRKEQAEKGIPNPFEPSQQKPEEAAKSNVKQIYRGTPDVELRRVIADPRIDDGYVQNLLQQRAR